MLHAARSWNSRPDGSFCLQPGAGGRQVVLSTGLSGRAKSPVQSRRYRRSRGLTLRRRQGRGMAISSIDSRFERLCGARVMITGGVGLIGSGLARRLVGLDCDVLLVDSMVP